MPKLRSTYGGIASVGFVAKNALSSKLISEMSYARITMLTNSEICSGPDVTKLDNHGLLTLLAYAYMAANDFEHPQVKPLYDEAIRRMESDPVTKLADNFALVEGQVPPEQPMEHSVCPKCGIVKTWVSNRFVCTWCESLSELTTPVAEELPKCSDCGGHTQRHGPVFDCHNCGKRMGGN